MEDEFKEYQTTYGERYVKVKTYAENLESELEDCRRNISALTTSHEELQEAFKERTRKARNWEKLYKTAKAQIQANNNNTMQENCSYGQQYKSSTSGLRDVRKPLFGIRNQNNFEMRSSSFDKIVDKRQMFFKQRPETPIAQSVIGQHHPSSVRRRMVTKR